MPKKQRTWVEVETAIASSMGSQLDALMDAAAKRGLNRGELEWHFALADRIITVGEQRVKVFMAVATSDKLSPEQRDALIAALTGRTLPMPALEASEGEGKP